MPCLFCQIKFSNLIFTLLNYKTDRSLFIFGLHISKIGAKVLLCYGMLLVGVAQILFGTLYNIKDPKVFRKVEN